MPGSGFTFPAGNGEIDFLIDFQDAETLTDLINTKMWFKGLCNLTVRQTVDFEVKILGRDSENQVTNITSNEQNIPGSSCKKKLMDSADFLGDINVGHKL